ncbi:hypothetical protein MSC49_32330 [Methylosinus sp. C49]|uniref:hypothetical protein n=1 Tax=Methylosinus sp. C49 TaxID=2699395 RepID=UPI0013671F47|nr:hypothetical protein [Methylosinus sp. C49]BBU63298.1 hypothetical protein MSC49_32330 [Methylosinus sp. C49]
MTRRILLLDPDRPGESLEVEVLARDDVVLTVSVPGTIVSFELLRRDDRGPYHGRLGGRSFSYVPAERANSQSASTRPKTSTRARSRTSRNPTPEDDAAPQSPGVERKGAWYGGTG